MGCGRQYNILCVISVLFSGTMPEWETYFTFVSPFYPTHTPASQIFGFYVCALAPDWSNYQDVAPHLTHTLLHTLHHLPCANVATQSYLNFLIIRQITDPREL